MEYSREQFIEMMTFGRPERPMFVELFPLSDEVVETWRAEGALVEEVEMISLDWDYVRSIGCGVRLGPLSPHEQGIAPGPDCGDEYAIPRNPVRRTTFTEIDDPEDESRRKRPLQTAADWQKIKPAWQFHPDRTDWSHVASAKKARATGTLVTARIPGAFQTARELMGEDDARIAFHDQPELMVDIIDTLTNSALRVYQRLADKLVPDVLCVRENLATAAGPLIGAEKVGEFIAPYYRALWRMMSARGTRLFQFESRGNITPLLDILVNAGINALYPMEVSAGMDFVAARKTYGRRLAMIGGIDKEVLRRGKSAIRRELESKMQPSMREGGMAFALDNSIPKGASLESYRYYVTLGCEILGLPPRSPRKPSWQR